MTWYCALFQELIATFVFLVSLDRIGFYFLNVPIGASLLLMSILLAFIFPHLNPWISIFLHCKDTDKISDMVELFEVFARIIAQLAAGFLAGSCLQYNYVDVAHKAKFSEYTNPMYKNNATIPAYKTGSNSIFFPLVEELFATFVFLTMVASIIEYRQRQKQDIDSSDKALKAALRVYVAVCISVGLTLFAFPTAKLNPAAMLCEWAVGRDIFTTYKEMDPDMVMFHWIRLAGGAVGLIACLILVHMTETLIPKTLEKEDKAPVSASTRLNNRTKGNDYIPMIFKHG